MIPSAENLQLCAEAILRGELVVVPTETVYGLAANALDPNAVERIYEVKRRPSWNPLIVHVNGIDMASTVGDVDQDAFLKLARAFWPGPLSIVVRSRGVVAERVTSGGKTVALRHPRHPVLCDLIERCGVPLAAPSANIFTRLSPTRAADVDPEILSQVFGVLDGGDCEIGIESTVVDLTSWIPNVLRLGDISLEDIRECLGVTPTFSSPESTTPSPGTHPVHYAPKGEVRLVTPEEAKQLLNIAPSRSDVIEYQGQDPKSYAKGLYSRLAEMDRLNLNPIYIVRPPDMAEWSAVWDRLRRASRAKTSDEP